LRYHADWDALLLDAITYLTSVEQPLRPLIKERVWAQLSDISQGKQKMKSILSCYYDRSVGVKKEADKVGQIDSSDFC
jgi:hypothetical protein